MSSTVALVQRKTGRIIGFHYPGFGNTPSCEEYEAIPCRQWISYHNGRPVMLLLDLPRAQSDPNCNRLQVQEGDRVFWAEIWDIPGCGQWRPMNARFTSGKSDSDESDHSESESESESDSDELGLTEEQAHRCQNLLREIAIKLEQQSDASPPESERPEQSGEADPAPAAEQEQAEQIVPPQAPTLRRRCDRPGWKPRQ